MWIAFMRVNYKKTIAVLTLAVVIFMAGRGIAGVRQGRTIGTFSIAGQSENWGLGFGAEGTTPTGTATAEELKQYDAYYVGDGQEKVIYLTFDCGYVDGYAGFAVCHTA
jgi:peptidoglycan-N-acetylmuramic acid deacetylase